MLSANFRAFAHFLAVIGALFGLARAGAQAPLSPAATTTDTPATSPATPAVQAVPTVAPSASASPAVADLPPAVEAAPPAPHLAPVGTSPSSPLPGWAVLQELKVLQEREAELWAKRETRSLAGPSVGIGLGIATSLVLLPIGSILLVDAKSYSYDGYGEDEVIDEHAQRIGRALVTTGVMALGLAVFCGWRIHDIKQRRIQQERELFTIGTTRTALEKVLGALLMGQPVQTNP